jgi:N utilization substance protein A
MKNEFIMAITQLSAEKNLPKEVVFEAVEAALASAYKKDLNANANVSVKIDRETGAVKVYTHKVVVEEVHNPRDEISLAEARKIRPDVEVGETIPFETVVHNAGRIAAQTAKQVVLQRLREAEREVVYDEYHGKEGDIISGVVRRTDGRQTIIDLGRTEAVLPASELPRNEHLRQDQRIKVYVLEVQKAAKGPQVIVSRTHKNLIRRLFELEVPEIHRGIVEIKSIAREPGSRSKVAVWSRDPQVDPVGACVGLRGIRIQNVVNELNGERIDVVLWDPDPAKFVANALSPARVTSVKVDEATNTATVIVPDQQLSLAIGKEGQNARLAAKLTGWRIDIKAESVAMRAPEAPAAVPETVYSAPAPSREELDEGARAPAAAPAAVAPKPPFCRRRRQRPNRSQKSRRPQRSPNRYR